MMTAKDDYTRLSTAVASLQGLDADSGKSVVAQTA